MAEIKGELKMVPVGLVTPNNWNYNEMNHEQMEKERNSLQTFGVVRAILAYWDEVKERYVIIDGEHRFKLMEEAGLTTVPVRVRNDLSLADAQALTIAINEIRGQDDFLKLADLFASISSFTPEEVASLVPYSPAEVKSLAEASDFDLDREFDFEGPEPEDMVSEHYTLTARVPVKDAELIETKAAVICGDLGIRSEKAAVQLGMLFAHLLENARQESGA